MARSFPGLALAALAIAVASGCGAPQFAKIAVQGDSRELRGRPKGAPTSSPGRTPVLYIALDGVGRDILYDGLRRGKLPGFAKLLGGADGQFPHAYFEEHLLSTLPSSTMAAWTTTMTGTPPAVHGVTGNEFFIREDRNFACPAPVSFSAAAPTISIFTDGYLDALGSSPTVYERMRESDPNILIWVAMHDVYRGADRLVLARKTVVANALEGFVEKQVERHLTDEQSRRVYQALDEGTVDSLVDVLKKEGPAPDVLTLYLSGTDLFAHVAEGGPDEARRTYLSQVLDPQIARLDATLETLGALQGRAVVIGADHGQTKVMHDEAHALSTKPGADPPAILEHAGFRVRPFQKDVSDKDPFSAVLAYGGAMAYVYLADRSGCAGDKDVCDWKQPPRYEEDVLAAAEAFRKNDQDGSIVPKMRGALDMILVRRPKPFAETDLPFEVYLGPHQTMAIDAWLAAHPHPTYVSVDARLRDLAVGPHGERAGDILLLAHNGDRDEPAQRFYFAAPYQSWHGSPSKRDSELPFIVASPRHSTAAIGAWVTSVLGDRPFQQKTTDVLLGLRAGALEK